MFYYTGSSKFYITINEGDQEIFLKTENVKRFVDVASGGNHVSMQILKDLHLPDIYYVFWYDQLIRCVTILPRIIL